MYNGTFHLLAFVVHVLSYLHCIVVHFRWDDAQEHAFIQLKEALCKTAVLAYPDPDLPYIMDTDASNLAVLSQVKDCEEKVIMNGSKAFSGSQQ